MKTEEKIICSHVNYGIKQSGLAPRFVFPVLLGSHTNRNSFVGEPLKSEICTWETKRVSDTT